MATNESMQNLLRLAFGGAQRGLNRFQQQQDQSADLMMSLQQMMAQRDQFQQRTDMMGEEFDWRKEQAKKNQLAQWGRDKMNQYRWDASHQLAQRQGARADRAAAAGEFDRSYARSQDNLAKMQELNKSVEVTKNLTALAEKYPQMAPYIDAMLASDDPNMMGSVMRGFAAGQAGPAKAPKPRAAQIAEYIDSFIKNPESFYALAGNQQMSPATMRSLAEQLVDGSDAIHFSQMNPDYLKRMEEELQAEIQRKRAGGFSVQQ